MPLTEARNRLSELIDEVERTHERVVITRHGEPAAVLLSPGDLEVLEETLEVLTSPDLVHQLQESEAAKATNDVLETDELGALTARRKRQT